MSGRTRRSRKSAKIESPEEMSPSPRKSCASQHQSDSEEDDDESAGQVSFSLSQQAPELSQPIPSVRQSERVNLESMGKENKSKALTDLSRLVLFKALAGEPIDRLKCAKEINISNSRITSAALDEVDVRLKNVFGFELRRIPKYMEGSKPMKRFRDRLFVINTVQDDDAGTHSKAIHSIHNSSAVEKGFLMIVLAFIYCKGVMQGGIRWIVDADLYRLLHDLDESIPEHPPSITNRRLYHTSSSSSRRGSDDGSPNADTLLERFVQMDYLLKQKTGQKTDSQKGGEQDEIMYAMGPRAAMEIGRKQVVYFCAEILDEEADPTMLAEIEDEDDGDKDAEHDEDITQTQTQTQ